MTTTSYSIINYELMMKLKNIKWEINVSLSQQEYRILEYTLSNVCMKNNGYEEYHHQPITYINNSNIVLSTYQNIILCQIFRYWPTSINGKEITVRSKYDTIK